MKVQPTEKRKKPDAFSRQRSLWPTVLAALLSLLIGGCLALLIVSQLLRIQSGLYTSVEAVAEAAAISQFMGDMLGLYFFCASLMLLLFLGLVALWARKKTQSRFLRTSSLLLFLLALASIAAIWIRGAIPA